VATKIKLMRLGKMREPHYRIVVADARTRRDGRAIETIGEYHPKNDPSVIKVDGERAAYWLGVGAQPTEAVTAILRVTGDWQKFKDEDAPPPMKMAPEKPDKQALFNAALAEVSGGPGEPGGGSATTPKKRAAKAAKPDEPKAEAVKPDEPKAEAVKPDEPKAEAVKPDEPKAEAVKPEEPKAEAAKPEEPKAETAEPAES